MVSLVDSEAQFQARLDQTRVPQAQRVALRTAGITTIAGFAYAYGQPGQPIDNDGFAAWVNAICPGSTVGSIASLKRLLFESQTQLLALLKEQVTSPDPTVPRKVPHAERESRLANLRARLAGVIVEGHSEPAHSLVDLACQLYEQNQLKFIPLDKCFSRLAELTNTSGKPIGKQLEVEASKVVLRDKEADIEISVQSSYQALEAFKRRGLALDMAGIMGYQHHDRYVQKLFAHLNREPPPGYTRCSVSQLIAADKQVWSKCIEENIKPRPDAAGVLALNTELAAKLESYEVSFALLPLPTKSSSGPSSSKQSVSHAASAPQQQKNLQGKGNRKGKRFTPYGMQAKGKGKYKYEQRIPQAIRDAGGVANTPDGDPVCFDYSLKRCSAKVADGARCDKGYHVCAICFGLHSMSDHKKA
eukprot:Skav228032  [mRNA]  locus=scaffold1188:3261:4511:+ [translate_table: standard]